MLAGGRRSCGPCICNATTPSLPPAFAPADDERATRSVWIEAPPEGRAQVDVDKLTHAVPQAEGTRLFLGAQHLDVPHTLAELENVPAGRERGDGGEHGSAGFHVR